jgi:hypothetical protein
MSTISYNESINTEREKANLLCLIKLGFWIFRKDKIYLVIRLTLNALIDQSSSPTALPILDDRNRDVTNFIITLERVLGFRMRGNEKKSKHHQNNFLFFNSRLVIRTTLFLGFYPTSMYRFLSSIE